MGKSERPSRKRYAFEHSNIDPEPTAVTEANAKQAFVDILDIGVIEPLAAFKVNETDLVWVCISLIIDDPEGNKR
jgi:hypothetical protein